MKTSKSRKKVSARSMKLTERKMDQRKFIEFPQMKGRTLDKVEFFTTPEYHSLTLFFEDKTSLTLVLDLCFLVAASFADGGSGTQRVLKRWPVIRSMASRA